MKTTSLIAIDKQLFLLQHINTKTKITVHLPEDFLKLAVEQSVLNAKCNNAKELEIPHAEGTIMTHTIRENDYKNIKDISGYFYRLKNFLVSLKDFYSEDIVIIVCDSEAAGHLIELFGGIKPEIVFPLMQETKETDPNPIVEALLTIKEVNILTQNAHVAFWYKQ